MICMGEVDFITPITPHASACPELCFVDRLSPRALGSSWESLDIPWLLGSIVVIVFSRNNIESLTVALVVFASDNGCLCVLHSASMRIVCCGCHRIFSSMAGSVHDLLCLGGLGSVVSLLLGPILLTFSCRCLIYIYLDIEDAWRKRTHFVLHGVLNPKYYARLKFDSR